MAAVSDVRSHAISVWGVLITLDFLTAAVSTHHKSALPSSLAVHYLYITIQVKLRYNRGGTDFLKRIAYY